jgi:hypothetical protein
MCIQFKTALVFFLMSVALNGQAACDSTTGTSPDANLTINLTIADINMGNFTRPDASNGASSVTISPVGVQTLANNLDVNPSSGSRNTNVYHAGEARVTGTAGCTFQITVTNIEADVSAITFQGKTNNDVLDTTVSGAIGTLKTDGTFDFRFGATFTISDTGSASTINKNFDVTVTYH